MGVVKSLKALSVIPKDQRTIEIDKKITELSEFLLLHHIYKKSHDLNAVAKPGWLRLGFPLMYQTDILEILEILTDLGVKDHRMNDAFEMVKKKQDKDGKWILENTFNGRMITKIEVKGKPSKWITLRAANVLMKFFLRSEP